jgi:hypothetical protein
MENISFVDFVLKYTYCKSNLYFYIHDNRIIGCYGDTHERYLWLKSKNYLTDISKY